MTIAVGEKLPNATMVTMGAEGPEEVQLSDKLAGRKVALFGLPGAFTGTCSTMHVPSFMRVMDQLKAKGVDEVICVSVNDVFVMDAWGKDTGGAEAGITFLGDAAAEFTKAIGMDFSAPPVGLIDRSKRFTMLVDDGEVKILNPEPSPGQCDISSGETLLDQI